MAKIRKTKKEKLRTSERVVQASSSASADERQAHSQGALYSYIAPSSSLPASHTTSTTSVSYLKHDLLRTGIVIGAIILAEIILFFSLTN